MRSNTQALEIKGHALSPQRLFRRSRSVTIRVMVGGREVDSFHCSDPETLQACLRPVYRHLDSFRGRVEFTGVEEKSLAGPVGRTHRRVALEGLEQALRFLGG